MSMRILAALCLSAAVSSAALAQPKIQSYTAEGDLESTNDLGCISLSEARSDYSPADMYPAVTKCVDEGDFERAVALFGLAGVYGKVDSERVSDRTAHQAVTVLRQNLFVSMSEDARKKMLETLSGIAGNEEQLAAICASIRSLGPPAYEPTYMIQHGMGAFTGQKNTVPEGFDIDQSFSNALTGYLKCPED